MKQKGTDKYCNIKILSQKVKQKWYKFSFFEKMRFSVKITVLFFKI